jgi:NAD(P)H-dependent FMN reductase
MRPGIEPNNELGLTRDTQRGERIAVVIGSTRPTRICPGIAQWFKQAIQRESPLHYALIDLAEIDLPFLDEPSSASSKVFTCVHSRTV